MKKIIIQLSFDIVYMRIKIFSRYTLEIDNCPHPKLSILGQIHH